MRHTRCRASMAACGKRILVVDQDARFRASVVSLVQGAGYEAISAGSGEEALFLARTESPHLAILDVELPGISGYEVCRRLREDVHAIGIVFVSDTRTDSLDRAAGLLIGADDYLAKPFAPDELLARVRALLNRNGTAHAVARPAPVALESALTAREHEVRHSSPAVCRRAASRSGSSSARRPSPRTSTTSWASSVSTAARRLSRSPTATVTSAFRRVWRNSDCAAGPRCSPRGRRPQSRP